MLITPVLKKGEIFFFGNARAIMINSLFFILYNFYLHQNIAPCRIFYIKASIKHFLYSTERFPDFSFKNKNKRKENTQLIFRIVILHCCYTIHTHTKPSLKKNNTHTHTKQKRSLQKTLMIWIDIPNWIWFCESSQYI